MPSPLAPSLLALLLLLPSAAQARKVRGVWNGPLGLVKLTQRGVRVRGRLVRPVEACGLAKGARVVDGTLLAGNFSGKVLLCQTGCAEEGTQWAFAMLVLAGRRLSGAAAMKVAPGCEVRGRSEKGAIVFRRRKTRVKASARDEAPLSPPPLVAAPGDLDDVGAAPGGESAGQAGAAHAMVGPRTEGYDPRAAADVREKAMNVARDGAAFLEEGRFEKARERFEEAVRIDPTYAEGYNGIGVTHALRRDWEEAVRWYQRSIGTNPDIGDAYYNLACAYAQTGKPDLAVRYLRIAVLNGYSEVAHLKEDPDLAPLRGRKDYEGVLRLGAITTGQASGGE